MRHALACWGVCPSVCRFECNRSGSHQRHHSPTAVCRDRRNVDAQALSPDVAEWTSHLIVTTPTAITAEALTASPVGCWPHLADRPSSSPGARCASWACPTSSGEPARRASTAPGYVQHVFAMLGIGLPRTADAQYDAGRPAVGGPRPGDLVFLRHLRRRLARRASISGTGQFVHASSSHGVMVSHLSESYWASRYVGAKRLIATH